MPSESNLANTSSLLAMFPRMQGDDIRLSRVVARTCTWDDFTLCRRVASLLTHDHYGHGRSCTRIFIYYLVGLRRPAGYMPRAHSGRFERPSSGLGNLGPIPWTQSAIGSPLSCCHLSPTMSRSGHHWMARMESARVERACFSISG